jgi:hypothetical protein
MLSEEATPLPDSSSDNTLINTFIGKKEKLFTKIQFPAIGLSPGTFPPIRTAKQKNWELACDIQAIMRTVADISIYRWIFAHCLSLYGPCAGVQIGSSLKSHRHRRFLSGMYLGTGIVDAYQSAKNPSGTPGAGSG